MNKRSYTQKCNGKGESEKAGPNSFGKYPINEHKASIVCANRARIVF